MINSLSTMTEELAKQSQDIILEQLNDLISRNLLVVEQGPLQLIQEYNSNTIKVAQNVKLVLKDKEYIEKLEKENQELKNTIEYFKNFINAFNNKL